jgi:uncharacterized protein YhhL (DUF1145 family)
MLKLCPTESQEPDCKLETTSVLVLPRAWLTVGFAAMVMVVMVEAKQFLPPNPQEGARALPIPSQFQTWAPSIEYLILESRLAKYWRLLRWAKKWK